jgi:hypothetical protein
MVMELYAKYFSSNTKKVVGVSVPQKYKGTQQLAQGEPNACVPTRH